MCGTLCFIENLSIDEINQLIILGLFQMNI